MRRNLHDAWWHLTSQSQPQTIGEALLTDALTAASGIFGFGLALRASAFNRGWLRIERVACPVVSVGNLSLGGTGKTVCVELVAGKLQERFKRVAVLSRGYGASGSYCLRSTHGRLEIEALRLPLPAQLADEPKLLARRLPGTAIVVGKDRVFSGRWAIRTQGSQALVLDDGFQHRRLHRDCDIVLVHARMPFGGWSLLPRGAMREPVEALRRADVVILTRAPEALDKIGPWHEHVRALNPTAVFASAAHEPTEVIDAQLGTSHPVSFLAGKRIAALSAVGDPRGFENTLHQAHATLLWHRSFPDHHPYTESEFKIVIEQVQRARADALVTTEKDWMRLEPLAVRCSIPIWLLRVRMKLLSGEKELDARLARL